MKKFLDYVEMCEDNDDYLFPSPIGHFVVIAILVIIIRVFNVYAEVNYNSFGTWVFLTNYRYQ